MCVFCVRVFVMSRGNHVFVWLSFGVLFATIVTLVFIPSLYMIIEDLRGVFSRKKKKQQTDDITVKPQELPSS